MKKTAVILATLLTGALILSGCGNKKSGQPETGDKKNKTKVEQTKKLTPGEMTESFEREVAGDWIMTEENEGLKISMKAEFENGKMSMGIVMDDETRAILTESGEDIDELEAAFEDAFSDVSYSVKDLDNEGVYTLKIQDSDNFVLVKEGKLYMGGVRKGFPENAEMVFTKED